MGSFTYRARGEVKGRGGKAGYSKEGFRGRGQGLRKRVVQFTFTGAGQGVGSGVGSGVKKMGKINLKNYTYFNT